jgi:hypothetical protein
MTLAPAVQLAGSASHWRSNRIHVAVTSIAARDSRVNALSALPLACDLAVVDRRAYVRDL